MLTGHHGDEQRRHLAWETALDRLELDVLVAERLVGGVGDASAPLPTLHTWDQPTDLGPLPRDLLARAQDLAGRQQRTLLALAAAGRAVRQQQVEDRRPAPAAPPEVRSAFLDVTA